MEIKGIKYIGPAFEPSGYGQAVRDNVCALSKIGIPVVLSPISFNTIESDYGNEEKRLKELIHKRVDYNVIIMHTTPEHWSKLRENNVCNVGYTIWETTRLHNDWAEYINNNVAKVLVGCEWNVDVFKQSGVNVPIGVVPHGISFDELNDFEEINITGIGDETYVFYSIFQWTERKNPLALVKAYWHTFQNNENVALVLKTYADDCSGGQSERIKMSIKKAKSVTPMKFYPKIFFISDLLTNKEINGIHMLGDCYVSFDRGEGFGLCPFKAGAFGKPIIVTGFGGVTEYAKPDNSFLINYTLEPVFGMPWSPWYRGDQLWAYPDIKHGSDLMRFVYENRAVANERGGRLKDFISNNFTFDIIARKIIEEIHKI